MKLASVRYEDEDVVAVHLDEDRDMGSWRLHSTR